MRTAVLGPQKSAAAASEKKEAMLQRLGPLVGWTYANSPCFPVV